MTIAAPPPMPSAMPAHAEPSASRCGKGRACARSGARKCAKLASSPTRGLVTVMVGATIIATILAVVQLSQGTPGRMAANTLFAAAGFNLLFTALSAPLLALFAIRSGVCRSVGTFFATIGRGLAYTLGLLFVSVAVLVGLGVAFG